LELPEGSDAGLRFLIVAGLRHQDGDPTDLSAGRLRECRGRQAAAPREYLGNSAASSPNCEQMSPGVFLKLVQLDRLDGPIPQCLPGS
jgi:hypothetical protein